ncbi:MAG: hypothetical protein NXY57DRAFT_877323, partial [Lentinula lateritia]
IQLSGVESGLLPMIPSEARFNIINRNGTKVQITRRQLALTPGYAFTDYKGQGQTIEYVIVDL